MTFSLTGGFGLLAVVALWVLVMIPSWSRPKSKESRVSTRSRNLRTSFQKTSKSNRFGVSRKENFRNKNRRVRSVFGFLLVASIGVVAHGIYQTLSGLGWLIEVAMGAVLFSFSASVIRSTAPKRAVRRPVSDARRAADRARIAYSIRESALPDAATDQLFDERAWTDSQLPTSSFTRRIGSIDLSQLGEVVSLEDARSESSKRFLDSEQLDSILKRRRSGE